MRILVAIDSLKGSLSSLEAGLAIKEALEDFCDVVVKPVADGGEGSVEAMADALDAKFIDTIVKNPLGTEILARYALKDDLAILEMSSASGLTLINPDERNP
ncbi:glycerate kinase, partial [Campylobacter concisus]